MAVAEVAGNQPLVAEWHHPQMAAAERGMVIKQQKFAAGSMTESASSVKRTETGTGDLAWVVARPCTLVAAALYQLLVAGQLLVTGRATPHQPLGDVTGRPYQHWEAGETGTGPPLEASQALSMQTAQRLMCEGR